MRMSQPGPRGQASVAGWRRWLFPVTVAAGLAGLLALSGGHPAGVPLTYTQFVADVGAGTVRAVTIGPAGQVSGSLAGGQPFTSTIPVALGGNTLALDSVFGLTIPFTPLAVVMAETFVAMPFLIITVEGALRSADQGFEEAAATLGAKRMTVFRRVTVPLVAPSLGAGAVLCWARALGEFGATITFAGSFPGQTETMPIAVYYALETDPDAAIALSLVLLLVSVVVLVSLRDRWLRRGPVQ